MAETRRVCGNSFKDAPHYLEQDSNGSWYCPLERGARNERKYADRRRAEQRLELAKAIQAYPPAAEKMPWEESEFAHEMYLEFADAVIAAGWQPPQ